MRSIRMILKYNWSQFDTSIIQKNVDPYLEMNMNDEANAPSNFAYIGLEHLEKPECIQAIKDFLTGKKRYEDIYWKKWEIKK